MNHKPKKWIGWILAALLLTGCVSPPVEPTWGTDGTEPATTERPATVQTEAPTVPVTEPPANLLDNAQPVGVAGDLVYIPNDHLQTMERAQMCLLGQDLLLSSYVASETKSELILRRISLRDGSLLAEASFRTSGMVKVYAGEDAVGLCDSATGTVMILDGEMKQQKSYTFPQEGGDWYLSPDLERLYVIFYSQGVLCTELETGEQTWVVDNAAYVHVQNADEDYVLINYTDREDQKIHTKCLDLGDGMVEELPIKGNFSTVQRVGKTYLARRINNEEEAVLITEGETRIFDDLQQSARLVGPREELLLTDSKYQQLYLYATDGTFLSQCALDPGEGEAVSQILWSDAWGGYFLLADQGGAVRLLFWDVFAPTQGEDLTMNSGETEQKEKLLDQELYDLAEQMSQQFGVQICIGEQCALDYTHYNSYALTDPGFVREVLALLKQTLGLYPDGFLPQLCYGGVEQFRIEIVGGLTVKDDITTHPGSAGGFAQTWADRHVIVLDGFMCSQETITHELAHIIDKRLAWDAELREGAMFSEDTWLSLQPVGFDYAYSYLHMPDEVQAYWDSGYFVSDYAMTYPTEDRATLMAEAMGNRYWGFTRDSGRYAKMDYYAKCIRDCFDTQGWPEVTGWETVLQ